MTQDSVAPRKALNPWVKFALELGPLALFFAVFSRLGIFAATGVLMAGVAATLSFRGRCCAGCRSCRLSPPSSSLVFGTLTLILQDKTFIKVKLTALYLLFGVALFVGGDQEPLLKIMFDGALRVTEEGWRRLTRRWAFFFLALAVLNELVCAPRRPTSG